MMNIQGVLRMAGCAFVLVHDDKMVAAGPNGKSAFRLHIVDTNFPVYTNPQGWPVGDYGASGLADFNQDGDQDVFACGAEVSEGPWKWVIWENSDGRARQLVPHVILDARLGDHEVRIGEVDGDGDLDMVSKRWQPSRQSAVGGRSMWISSRMCSTKGHRDKPSHTGEGMRRSMRRMTYLSVLLGGLIPLSLTAQTPTPSKNADVMLVTGVLRIHPENPRYFTDGTKMPDGSMRAIYLTGSHTWGNLCDYRERWPAFDFTGYLGFLERYHHNFIRLWSGDGLGPQPVPYARTGPGTANDGGLKVDLDRLDPAFFDRLRSRVVAARDRGIYVGIMLFSPDSGAKREDWEDLFYHPANNVQGINADTNGDGSGAEAYDLSIPRITAWQEAFVRKVVDTVNDLNNVLYEIGNEGDLTSVPWQYHFIRFIKQYEAGKPRQHPVGMTAVFNILNGSWATDNRVLFESPADWVSPGLDPYKDNPPVSDGRKVIIADVDHIWPAAPHRGWIWECFLRGIQPILMDWYSYGDPKWTSSDEQEAMRRYMGYALAYANKVNLSAMKPRPELVSTGYCLANPGKEYLVYQPKPGEAFSIELMPGTYHCEWFDPTKGDSAEAGHVKASGGAQPLQPPFEADAVLYLKKMSTLE